MATKVPVTNLTNLANETSAVTTINTNINNLANAIDLLLSRDGKSPNSIDANLDMNSKRIVNLPEPISDTEPARVADVNVIAADALVARDQTLTYRNQAQTSANNAATAASQAITAKNDAETSRVRAGNSATTATNAANAASVSQRSANKSEVSAARSAHEAKQAAEASASVYYSQYDTKADASADVASIPADATILVYNDESQGGARTIYRKESGSLVFKTVAGMDLDDVYTPNVSDGVPRTVRSKLLEVVSIKDFGAIGDGIEHPLSEKYSSLAEAQAVYPHATALSNSIDWCAIQAAFNYVESIGLGQIYVPQGHYITHTLLHVPDNCEIYGAGDASVIQNTNSGSDNRFKAVFDFGFLHPTHYGFRPTGSSDPYTRILDRYAAGAVTTSDKKVTLTTVGDAANFEVGEIILIVDATVNTQTSTGVEIEIPINTTVSVVTGANPATGDVTFDGTVGFNAANVYAVRIPEGASETGIPIKVVRNSHIRDLRIVGRGTVCLAAACYRSSIRNITGKVAWLLQGNAFVQSSVSNINQEFTVGAIEVKFGAHDTTITNIKGFCFSPESSSLGVMGYGEYCRNITIDGFDITAPTITGRLGMQLQPGYNCVIRNGRLVLSSVTQSMVTYYADSAKPITLCGVDNVDFFSASRNSISFASNLTNQPKGCYVKNSRFFSSNPDADLAGIVIAFDGGTENEVTNCYFEKGARVRFNGSSGSIFHNNIIQQFAGFLGTSIAANAEGVSGNKKLETGVYGHIGFDTISPDRGNADYTVVANSPRTNIWKTALTGTRTVNFTTTNMVAGRQYRIVRAASATGASNLNLSGLSKSLSPGTWADVMFDGTSMVLVASGAL